MEAIILAGGLGTRLRTITNGLPKPMAPMGSEPFLAVLLTYLVKQGVDRVILSVGYKYEAIQSYFGDCYSSCKLTYSIEHDLLGTGGAIRQALQHTQADPVLVVNGDTLFEIPLNRMLSFHLDHQADLTLALKPMLNFDRYGNVVLSNTQIVRFEEKQHCIQGNINGGVYLINRTLFERFNLPSKFSFETDFLQRYLDQIRVHGFSCSEYFVDIGIPEDYQKAQREIGVRA
ncbi:nucleotidyltransferase family protein [Leptolyngbya sp. AN03gr2]|uniref:nucleotidyltransferase family protein n=1 Tax=unclassified Leptolyngbya TaxID=2650499 RepID=UPI003D31A579